MTKVEIENKADKVELENEADKKAELYANELANRRLFEKPTPYIVGLEEGYSDGYIAGAESREKQIEELKQENIELKEQNRNYEQLIDNGSVTLAKERLKNYKQLTKAKEIIKGWLGDFYNPKAFYDKRAELVEQSEQFLQEIEK